MASGIYLNLRQWLHLKQWRTLKEVCDATKLSRTTIWRKVNNGTFPAPFKASSKRIVWNDKEVEDWQEKQAAKVRRQII